MGPGRAGAAITGFGTSLPGAELDNDELAARLGVSKEWIFERTGIESRHVVGSGSETTCSLAAAAAREALERAGVQPDEVDLVIVATVTPDFQIPAVASMVQAAIGANNAGAFDLNAGCSGFLYALAQADALVSCGTCDRVLVCGADVLSKVTDYSDPRSCILFGDGAGAVVVERVEGPSMIGPFELGSDGSEPELLFISPDERLIRMQGREVYKRAVSAMSGSVERVLRRAGVAGDEIALVVAHQANARILSAVAEQLSLREDQVFVNIERLGNTSAASIPLALAEGVHNERIKTDDLLMLTAFGAGFTWATCLVRWASVGSEFEFAALGVPVHG